MPGRNGMGPAGAGPMTGKGRGSCDPSLSQLNANRDARVRLTKAEALKNKARYLQEQLDITKKQIDTLSD